MSKHITGNVLKFRKELIANGFTVDEGDIWKIYQVGGPFYSFHPSEKGINPCKRWIQLNYKVDLRNRQKKNLTKREQRANMGQRMQEAEALAKLCKNRFSELANWLKDTHENVYQEFMERYE